MSKVLAQIAALLVAAIFPLMTSFADAKEIKDRGSNSFLFGSHHGEKRPSIIVRGAQPSQAKFYERRGHWRDGKRPSIVFRGERQRQVQFGNRRGHQNSDALRFRLRDDSELADNFFRGLPPGLAKRDPLPPGLFKRYTLPPGLDKFHADSPGLAKRVTAPPGLSQ